MKTFLNNYSEWVAVTKSIGWVHIHNDLIVVDIDEVCIAEWDSINNNGWVYTEFLT